MGKRKRQLALNQTTGALSDDWDSYDDWLDSFYDSKPKAETKPAEKAERALGNWRADVERADTADWRTRYATVSRPTAPTIPTSVSYRCLSCGHWFGSESEFTAHVQFACPGRFPAETLALGVQCECCHGLDATLVIKPTVTEQTERGSA